MASCSRLLEKSNQGCEILGQAVGRDFNAHLSHSRACDPSVTLIGTLPTLVAENIDFVR
jgi:hypothetical protein